MEKIKSASVSLTIPVHDVSVVDAQNNEEMRSIGRRTIKFLVVVVLFIGVYGTFLDEESPLLKAFGTGDMTLKTNISVVDIIQTTTKQSVETTTTNHTTTTTTTTVTAPETITVDAFVVVVSKHTTDMKKVCPKFCENSKDDISHESEPSAAGATSTVSICNRTHRSCSHLVNREYGRGEGNLILDLLNERSSILSPNGTSVLFDCGDDASREAKNNVIPWVSWLFVNHSVFYLSILLPTVLTP
jgi:hypothetical protein